ncbi:MAG TPA: biopolymer transporter ExbD [Burkholderiales bacterium]|nr:biopolymer transporter ExbD [Betaproteobacteria bacterium]HQR53005.1 biopolymer transporter ExbD [Burkholderiales bacterium]
MAIISSSDDDGMMADINVTPLVDVMLVLLTVFIVTAPLLVNAVSVKLPKANASAASSNLTNVRISVTAAGVVYLNEATLAPSGIADALRRLRAQGEVSVEILADEKVPYGAVAKVMAQIQNASVSKFSFVTLPETDPQHP